MKTKKYLLSFMSAAFIAAMSTSCTDTVTVSGDNPIEAQSEIKLNGKVLTAEAQTYAPVDGIGSSFSAKVLLSEATGDYTSTGILHEGTMTFIDDDATGTGTAVGFTTPQYYPADGSDVYLTGLYPATTWSGTTPSLTFTFNGSQDVMATAEINTKKSDAPSSYKTFIFKHLLTLLDVYVIAEDGAAKTAWGNVTQIEVIGAEGVATLKNIVGVTLNATTPATATYSGSATTIPTYEPSTDNAFTTASTAVSLPLPTVLLPTPVIVFSEATKAAYTMVAPITTADGTNDYKLKVYTEEQPAGVDVEVGLANGPTVGNKYNVLLIFKSTEIKAKATVTPWADGGSGSGVIQ